MKTKSLFIVILGFLVLSIGGPAYGWQGRMGGMGDPYGLVQDESDFLIHPAGIAIGKGINFYGGYRFSYRDVINWDYKLNVLGAFTSFPYSTSGDELKHDGHFGMAFPVGPGRMGLFLEYSGMRGDYDGRETGSFFGTPFVYKLNMESDLDAFALRLLYGLPVGGFKLGGEFQFAYRKENNSNKMTIPAGDPFYSPAILKNFPLSEGFFATISPHMFNLFPFFIPFDSSYLEGLLKGSLEGSLGPMKVAFTAKGSLIFDGDNKYKFLGTAFDPTAGSKLSGDVKGWSLGGDLWLRYRLMEGLSLPFLVKVGYQEKKRNGDGIPTLSMLAGSNLDYENKEKNFQLEVGGGLDKEMAKGTRIAAGIYYDYLTYKNSFIFNVVYPGSPFSWDLNDYPNQKEHQLVLRLSGEKELSPTFSMGMGLSFFYSWVKRDFANSFLLGAIYKDDISTDGYRWGFGLSLGGAVKFNGFTLEPFLGGGYQKLKLEGDGTSTMPLFMTPPFVYKMDMKRDEWFIGGGFSIKF